MQAGKSSRVSAVGRGATSNPPNRFENVHREDDWEHLEQAGELPEQVALRTEFLPDQSQTVITETDSPDVPFRFSINPYRGCEHGCAYCYARPYHELLGMNAGLDFETKILCKFDAAKLLRRELNRSGWQGDVICLSGVTDCYQPAERQFRITRGLLEVMREAEQAVSIVTKNSLILRDLDLLGEMGRQRLAQVNISLPSLDQELTRVMEPRTAAPAARLRAIRELTEAGVAVRVLIAPIIPGLTDHSVPQVMQAAKEAGAMEAHYTLLRLPLSVAPVFLDWVDTHRPDFRARIEQRIRATRDGRLNDSQFGTRMSGSGAYAETIRNAFSAFAKHFALDHPLPPLDTRRFRPPKAASGQLRLF
ncbi:MAG: PA0069 family radical SAM protein [Pirellulaceae bacterium]|nr:PA0069 family radical SAM protein [Pirellulaceae bacterium]